MIGKIKYVLILLLVIIFTDSSAQNSQILYNMNLPQNHLLNPAFRPSSSFYIGLPAISGINLNINNNFVNFSDVFMPGQSSDSIITFLHPEYNTDDFLSKIREKNSFESQFSVQLFGLGFSAGKDLYVFLDINEHAEGNVVLPGNLFKLALKGNEGFVGNTIDLSSLREDMKYYREIGLGFSKNITNKLRIGVKGKLLCGIATASIDNRALGITVNPDYSLKLNTDLMINISGPFILYKDANNNIDSIVIDDSRFKGSNKVKEITDFVLGKRNFGLGLDIGATYDFSDKLSVSAAVTDLGFIKWRKDLVNVQAESSFEFSGLNMLDVVNGTKTIDELGQEMLDSLGNSFTISDYNSQFTTYLPVGVSIGGSYKLTRSFSVGLLSYSRFIGKQMRESLTVSANVNLTNAFSASIGYTIANHRIDNLGAGLAFRTGIFQFYMVSDRIPVMWNKIKVDNSSTLLLPASWNTINLRLGMNLVFGYKEKNKENKPMMEVDKVYY